MKSHKTYSGLITSLPPNGIFVFGANTEGNHGAGAAKVAKEKFGAIYGTIGLQGQSYGIITKDLRVNKHPSISSRIIISQVEALYFYASVMKDKDFYIAYSGSGYNLNGYSPLDMAYIFSSAGPIPENIVFEEEFYSLIHPSRKGDEDE